MYLIDPPPPGVGFVVELSIALPTHGQAADEGHSGFAFAGIVLKKIENTRINNVTKIFVFIDLPISRVI